MTLTDVINARREWLQEHTKAPSVLFVPQNLTEDFWKMCGEQPVTGFGHCGMAYILGMRIETSPFKSNKLEFA